MIFPPTYLTADQIDALGSERLTDLQRRTIAARFAEPGATTLAHALQWIDPAGKHWIMCADDTVPRAPRPFEFRILPCGCAAREPIDPDFFER